MAKSRKKAVPKEPIDVKKEFVEALAERPQARSRRQTDAPVAEVGDKVTLVNSKSGSVYQITQVIGDSVNLLLPGTNLTRFRVPVSDLSFVEKVPRATAKPAKPAFDAEEIREHIAAVQHKAIDELNSEIALLKKYLQSKHAPPKASNDLDRFYKQQQEAWDSIVAKILELLEE